MPGKGPSLRAQGRASFNRARPYTKKIILLFVYSNIAFDLKERHHHCDIFGYSDYRDFILYTPMILFPLRGRGQRNLNSTHYLIRLIF